MTVTIVLAFWILAMCAILAYLAWNLRKLWRSAKRFGRQAARLAQAPSDAARRHAPRERDRPTPAPFHDFRRRQANEDRARVRAERSMRRAGRLDRATRRWQAEGDTPYAHLDRKQALASYHARKRESGRDRRTQ